MNEHTPNTPITVLHFCEHFGGKEASLHGVARAFQWWLPGFDPTQFRMLLCSRKGHDKAAAQMEAGGLAPITLGYSKMDPRNLTGLKRLVRTEKVDIIHAHGFGACAWARIVGMLTHTPVVIHGRANYGSVPLVMKPFERFLGPRTRYALAVSESTRQFMIHMRHVPAKAVDVLYNGILLDHITLLPEADRTQMRAALGADEQTQIFGVVGRIVSHKGHLDAFRAIETLRKTHPAAKLWVVGDGDFTPQLEAWIHEHNADDYIQLLGFRTDVIQLIQCFDAQLFPSHMEGTPNTLYEALAVGNVAVACPTDGQGEILEDEETALMFPVGDSDAMAACMRRVLDEPETRKTLKAAALARSKDLDGRNCIAGMATLYQRIMAEQRA